MKSIGHEPMSQVSGLDPYVPSSYKASPAGGQGSRAANTAIGSQNWQSPEVSDFVEFSAMFC